MRVPQEKLDQILGECSRFYGRRRVSTESLQSLLGRLLYVAKVVVPARAFLNRMLSYLRIQQGPVIYLGEAFEKELNWFTSLLCDFNRAPSFGVIDQNGIQDIFVDASLEGIGGCWNKNAYCDHIPNVIKQGSGIVHFEMFNVYVALRHWAKLLQGQTVRVNSDNMAVVQIVNSYRTNDPFLGMCIRIILWVAARYNFHVVAEHIPWALNTIADALSRLNQDEAEYRWVSTDMDLNIQTLGKEALTLNEII